MSVDLTPLVALAADAVRLEDAAYARAGVAALRGTLGMLEWERKALGDLCDAILTGHPELIAIRAEMAELTMTASDDAATRAAAELVTGDSPLSTDGSGRPELVATLGALAKDMRAKVGGASAGSESRGSWALDGTQEERLDLPLRELLNCLRQFMDSLGDREQSGRSRRRDKVDVEYAGGGFAGVGGSGFVGHGDVSSVKAGSDAASSGVPAMNVAERQGVTVRVTTLDGRVLSETVFPESKSPFCAKHPGGTYDACTGCRMTRDGRAVAE